jgi:hypothetical protein
VLENVVAFVFHKHLFDFALLVDQFVLINDPGCEIVLILLLDIDDLVFIELLFSKFVIP